MKNCLQKILHNTKDNKLRSSYLIKLCSIVIISFILIGVDIFLQADYASASSGVRIYNYTSKKEYTYSDAQVRVTYNGKKISVDSTPGIIQNGIALVSYKDIFARSDVKADCVYDKAAGTVSISKSGTTIVMKIGSKTAYINGREVTAPLAPVKIKYLKADVTKILVPSRFVFENLGYTYTWNKNTSTVSVQGKQEPLLLSYNNGEQFYYNGTQGRVTIDGKNINLGNMPSIITNNTAMLRAKRVFTDKNINAEYNYNSKDKTVTLSRNGNTLVMKIDSPVAHLNGRAIVLDVAPMIVTNHDVGVSYVMVPGSFTASCLGFDYRWDKANATSIFTSREEDNNNENDPSDSNKPNDSSDPSKDDQDNKELEKDQEPELGDSAVAWDKGTILYQWEGFQEIIGVSDGVHSIDGHTPKDEFYSIYSISKDYRNVKLNTESYAIVASSPFSTVSSKVSGGQLSLSIANMTCVANTYNLSYVNGGMIDNIRLYNDENISSKVEFNLLTDKFTYDLELSPDKQTLYVTLYYNSLNKVTIGTNEEMDYITLTGLAPLEPIIQQMPGLLSIELPKTKKSIDDQHLNITGTKHLYNASIYYVGESTYIYLGTSGSNEYYTYEEDNNYTIILPKNDGFTPPVLDDNKSPTNPTTPARPDYPIGDISEYELIIPNPAGLSLNQLRHEDQYSKKRFSIYIPGDYVSYLLNNPALVNSSAITDVSVFLNSNYETEIMVSTSKIQGYELFVDKDFIYVNVGNPRDIYKNIVVLDPGHGGSAPGAVYFNTKEKDLNYKVLYEIGKDLYNLDSSLLKVYYTRETDVDVSLANRAAFAESVGADLFVSLHMNANTNTSVYGTEVYYSNSNNKKNKAGLNSEILANIFVNNLSSSLNTRNRGTRAARYTVVHNNTVPAVLLELGFMSNKKEFETLSNPAFQYQAAKVIYETLLEVFDKYPTGR